MRWASYATRAYHLKCGIALPHVYLMLHVWLTSVKLVQKNQSPYVVSTISRDLCLNFELVSRIYDLPRNGSEEETHVIADGD